MSRYQQHEYYKDQVDLPDDFMIELIKEDERLTEIINKSLDKKFKDYEGMDPIKDKDESHELDEMLRLNLRKRKNLKYIERT